MSRLRRIVARWLLAALIITAMSGLAYLLAQQTLRHLANDPQIQMAEDAAARLASGGRPEAVVPQEMVAIDRSLAPFLIVFDETGKAVASSATLDGQTPPGQMPAVPAGVLPYTRQHGQDRITWQPRSGVRIAAVIQHFDGATPGFVLAGRSLREVERRADSLLELAGLGWLATMAAALLVAALAEFLVPTRDSSLRSV